jgi:DNA-binding NarL/FixJ family response regulator
VIRVAIVENETLVREGLRRVLELDGGLVVEGEARDGAEAIEMLRRSRPDVALLDVRMPRADGIAVLRALAEDADPIRCIVLTTFDDADAFLAAARAGARGYLLKDASPRELGDAIRAVAGGGTWFKPAVSDTVLRGLASLQTGETPDEMAEDLTVREREVLRLLAGGYSNKEIGDALGVAERTVKNHVASILGKLWVRDRTRAVLKALSLRLL